MRCAFSYAKKKTPTRVANETRRQSGHKEGIGTYQDHQAEKDDVGEKVSRLRKTTRFLLETA